MESLLEHHFILMVLHRLMLVAVGFLNHLEEVVRADHLVLSGKIMVRRVVLNRMICYKNQEHWPPFHLYRAKALDAHQVAAHLNPIGYVNQS